MPAAFKPSVSGNSVSLQGLTPNFFALARYLKFPVGKLGCTEGNNWARNEKHGVAPW
jgi:hypothetical protein